MLRLEARFRKPVVCLAAGALVLMIGFPSSPDPILGTTERTEFISTLPPPTSGTDLPTCFCRAADTKEVLCNQDPSIAWTFGSEQYCPADTASCPDHEVAGISGDVCTGFRFVPEGPCGTWVPVEGKIVCLGGRID